MYNPMFAGLKILGLPKPHKPGFRFHVEDNTSEAESST